MMEMVYTLCEGDLSRLGVVRHVPYRIALQWVAIKQNEFDDMEERRGR